MLGGFEAPRNRRAEIFDALLDAQVVEILAGINSKPYTSVRGYCGGAKWLSDVLQLLNSSAPNTTAVSERQQPENPCPDPVGTPAMAENLLPTFSGQSDVKNVPNYQSHELFSDFSATRELRVVKGISKEVLLTYDSSPPAATLPVP